MRIVISKSKINKTAKLNWLTTSGGVRIAATTKMITIQYLLLRLKSLADNKSSLINKSNKIGNWNATPNPSSKFSTKFRYSLNLVSSWIEKLDEPTKPLVSKLAKNCKAIGKIKKYAKIAPHKNKNGEKKKIKRIFFFSFF